MEPFIVSGSTPRPPGPRLAQTGHGLNMRSLAIGFALLLSLMLTLAPAALASSQPESDTPVEPRLRVFGVGDCVMLGGRAALERAIEGVEVDAAVSRQAATGIDILRSRAAVGITEDVVIFHLGNNGPLTADQFDEVMAAVPGVTRVVFVTLTVPRPWQAANNAVITDGVGRYPNAVVADWHAASSGRFDLLWDDGIHLRPEGADAYAALIAPLATLKELQVVFGQRAINK